MEKQAGETVQSLSDTGYSVTPRRGGRGFYIYIHTLAKKNVMEKQTGETVQSLSDTGCNAETGVAEGFMYIPWRRKNHGKADG